MKKWFYVLKRHHKVSSRYNRDYADVESVINDPPSTWAHYDNDPHKYRAIINMEINEMNSAKERGDHHGYTENLIHVAAACLCAHHAMTCKESD